MTELQGEKAQVTGRESLGCGHCEAVCPTGAIKVLANDATFSFASFSSTDKWLPPGKSDPSALASLIRSRRSCRNYTEGSVSQSILNDLISFGISAPSGTNSQMWTFTMVPTRADLVELGGQIFNYFSKLNRLAEQPVLRFFSLSPCESLVQPSANTFSVLYEFSCSEGSVYMERTCASVYPASSQ